ncbi:MAG: PadR family transcriptional regulator [Thaumarchaeota archaeon]|nr:PadR family transcriptional regulator [Nitrososphaerota archaeon]
MAETESVGFAKATSELVRKGGYDIESHGVVEGESGARHNVDLLCNYGGNILVDIKKGNDSVISVLSIYMKMLDSKSSRGVLIAVPRASSQARRLSPKYGLTLIEAESPDEAAVSLCRVISEARSSQARSSLVVPYEERVDPARFEAAYARKIRTRSVKNALDLIILLSLNQTTLTGYEVMSLVHRNLNTLLSPGTIYPVLNHLERQGLIISSETGRKKIYLQTRLCKEILASIMQAFEGDQRVILKFLFDQSRRMQSAKDTKESDSISINFSQLSNACSHGNGKFCELCSKECKPENCPFLVKKEVAF